MTECPFLSGAAVYITACITNLSHTCKPDTRLRVSTVCGWNQPSDNSPGQQVSLMVLAELRVLFSLPSFKITDSIGKVSLFSGNSIGLFTALTMLAFVLRQYRHFDVGTVVNKRRTF